MYLNAWTIKLIDNIEILKNLLIRFVKKIYNIVLPPYSEIILVGSKTDTNYWGNELDYSDRFLAINDYILNLWNKKELHNYIFGPSKSLGEGTMTIEALKYIEELNLEYQYLYMFQKPE